MPPRKRTPRRKSPATQAAPALDHVGSVSIHEAYTLDAIEQRLGLGPTAIREARRNERDQLKVRKFGRRRIILGEDLIAYLRSLPVEP